MTAETTPAMTDEEAEAQARRIIADFATAYRNTDPVPAVGSAPPVPQPGRPPMSSKAVDDTVRMLGASVLVAVTGGSGTALLWASGHADPLIVALVFGAPTALVLAVARLLRGARPEPDVHHHYEGTVLQQTTHSRNTGLWARTDNRQ